MRAMIGLISGMGELLVFAAGVAILIAAATLAS